MDFKIAWTTAWVSGFSNISAKMFRLRSRGRPALSSTDNSVVKVNKSPLAERQDNFFLKPSWAAAIFKGIRPETLSRSTAAF